mgnify:CR=1 FL=1
MTKPKQRTIALIVNGKPARVIGVIAGYVVVQIGNARPICLSFDEFDQASKPA